MHSLVVGAGLNHATLLLVSNLSLHLYGDSMVNTSRSFYMYYKQIVHFL